MDEAAQQRAEQDQQPAAIRTCRSSETAFLPRTTGSPACSQASVPPSTLMTCRTRRRGTARSLPARLPERQMT